MKKDMVGLIWLCACTAMTPPQIAAVVPSMAKDRKIARFMENLPE
jgi:hypothetical protein